MNNYDKMLEAARVRFLEYDIQTLAQKPGVGEDLSTTFLEEPVQINPQTGEITVGGRAANFGESLTIFDWLCDGRPDAVASRIYCPVSSLPGVLVRGSGLVMNASALAEKIDRDPAAFCRVCEALGAEKSGLGDIGYEIPVFPGLAAQVKFYHSDEEFPPSLTFLWDQNILQFLRYETVYYLAGCLRKRLETAMEDGN